MQSEQATETLPSGSRVRVVLLGDAYVCDLIGTVVGVGDHGIRLLAERTECGRLYGGSTAVPAERADQLVPWGRIDRIQFVHQPAAVA